MVLRQWPRRGTDDARRRRIDGNLNAGDLSKWTYAVDNGVETRSANRRDIYSFRLTGQVTQKNRPVVLP